jgi:thiol-disulfide isomerase/thioredoxin
MTTHDRDAIVGYHRPVEAILVSAPGCHFCRDAAELLGSLGKMYPLQVVEFDGHSPEGRSLVSRFRPPFMPVLLIDGEYFGHGRISRRKLEGHLARLYDGAGTPSTRES